VKIVEKSHEREKNTKTPYIGKEAREREKERDREGERERPLLIPVTVLSHSQRLFPDIE